MFNVFICVLMLRRPPRSTRTDTLLPSTPLFRSRDGRIDVVGLAILADTDWCDHRHEAASFEMRDDARIDAIDFADLTELVPGDLHRARADHPAILAGQPHRATSLQIERRDHRSEERRVGKECVRTGSSRWYPDP